MEAVARENCKRRDPGRGRDISERGGAREGGRRLLIARNQMGSIFRPNRGYWKWSRAKIVKGAIPGRDGILASADGRSREVAVSESREIERVAYLGQIKANESSRARELYKEGPQEGTGY